MTLSRVLLSTTSALALFASQADALSMHEFPPTWHKEHVWEKKTWGIKLRKGETLTARQLANSQDGMLKYYAIETELEGLKAVSSTGGIPGTACNTTVTTCAASLGYIVVKDFGGTSTGSGSGNDTPAITLAADAACTSGRLLVKFTPGKYNVQTQFNSPCNGLVFFADPQNISYDPENNPNAAVEIYINSGFFTTANHIWYNMNGYTDGVIANINVGGDGGQQGIGFIGDSFNYTGSGQAPRFYIFNMGAGGQGSLIGCGLNTSGVTGYATPYSGTGNVCSNYVGYRLVNVTASENAIAANGNITDLFWRGGQIAGNECGGVVGANVGTEGVFLTPDTIEENGENAVSGVCGIAGPGVELNGPVWEINTRFQGNKGVAVAFDGNAAYDTITGTFSGDGGNAAQGSESEFLFTGSLGAGITLNGLVGGSGVNGLTAPKYIFENISGTNSVGVVGGAYGSNNYSSGLINNVAGSVTLSPFVATGQTPQLSGITGTGASGFSITANDALGSTTSIVANRVGANGMLFIDNSYAVVDYAAQANNGNGATMRFEDRSSNFQNAGNVNGEWQPLLNNVSGNYNNAGYFGQQASGLSGHIGNIIGTTSAPTCGTGCASITSGSTDTRGSFTTSSSVTSAILNFGTTWTSAPTCTISDSNTTAVTDISALSTTALTLSFASSLSTVKVYYICMQ